MFRNINTTLRTLHNKATNPYTVIYSIGALAISFVLDRGNRMINGYDEENPGLLAELNEGAVYLVIGLAIYNSCNLIYKNVSGISHLNQFNQINHELGKISQDYNITQLCHELKFGLAFRDKEKIQKVFENVSKDILRLKGLFKYLNQLKKVDQFSEQYSISKDRIIERAIEGLADPDIENMIEEKKNELRKLDKGFTRGASVGFFRIVYPDMPKDVSVYISQFLTRENAGRISEVSPDIYNLAKKEEEFARQEQEFARQTIKPKPYS